DTVNFYLIGAASCFFFLGFAGIDVGISRGEGMQPHHTMVLATVGRDIYPIGSYPIGAASCFFFLGFMLFIAFQYYISFPPHVYAITYLDNNAQEATKEGM
ncbi:hypothetical protein ACJX0J_012359, partial [Zea mays]